MSLVKEWVVVEMEGESTVVMTVIGGWVEAVLQAEVVVEMGLHHLVVLVA